MLLGLCVIHTDDVQEFPEMSQHQQFLVPLRTLECTEKRPSGQASYYVLRAGPGTSEYTKYKIQNMELGILALKLMSS